MGTLKLYARVSTVVGDMHVEDHHAAMTSRGGGPCSHVYCRRIASQLLTMASLADKLLPLSTANR